MNIHSAKYLIILQKWLTLQDDLYAIKIACLTIATMNDLELVRSKIYEIRGQRVMLDFDLAELYQVETKQLKRAVRRNIQDLRAMILCLN